LQHAWERGVPMRWVTGDEVYGDNPNVRAAIRAEEGHYYYNRICINNSPRR